MWNLWFNYTQCKMRQMQVSLLSRNCSPYCKTGLFLYTNGLPEGARALTLLLLLFHMEGISVSIIVPLSLLMQQGMRHFFTAELSRKSPTSLPTPFYSSIFKVVSFLAKFEAIFYFQATVTSRAKSWTASWRNLWHQSTSLTVDLR